VERQKVNRLKIPTITIYQSSIDIEQAAQGMRISPELYRESLRDGRTIARWAEIWVSVIYKLQLTRTNTYAADSMGSLDSGYSTKALTEHGTAVRLSSNTGIGRKCEEEDVLRAIERVVAYNFVDNTDLPTLSFIQVPSGIIMKWFKEGYIGKKGTISHRKFYQVLGPTPIVQVSLLTGEKI
jgi:hypothetical protein